MFAALFAAIAWNYVTWYLGLPSSSSHAIIGGLVGAGLAAGGVAAISWDAVSKAVIGIVASPAVAFSIALVAMLLVAGVQRMFRLRDEHPVFKGLQLVSAGAISFGHAPTTLRRRWASSRPCSWRRGTPTSPATARRWRCPSG